VAGRRHGYSLTSKHYPPVRALVMAAGGATVFFAVYFVLALASRHRSPTSGMNQTPDFYCCCGSTHRRDRLLTNDDLSLVLSLFRADSGRAALHCHHLPHANNQGKQKRCWLGPAPPSACYRQFSSPRTMILHGGSEISHTFFFPRQTIFLVGERGASSPQ
jgi:hypothetical protein